MQTVVKSTQFAGDRQKAKEIKNGNLKRNLELIDGLFEGRSQSGAKEYTEELRIPMPIPTKLIVFPETQLAGFPFSGVTAKQWMEKGCITMPGEETDQFAECARKYNIYICGHAYELDPDWPGRYFNTAFIIDPSGKIALKYRKFCSLYATTPLDVLDEYIKKYGVDGMFPVIDTPIWKLAAAVCCDYGYPEVWRCLAMNGAEVVAHPTGGPNWYADPGGGRELMRKSRALENMYYIAYAQMGRLVDESLMEARMYGHSGIIDYEGKVVAEAPHAGEVVVREVIDIQILRRRRAARTMLQDNMNEAFAKFYEKHVMFPANKWRDKPMESPAEKFRVSGENLRELFKKGVFTAP
jgi:predicted amidohydrolase